MAAGYDRRAREVIGRVHRDLIARAAAFLLLNDSKSSFAIEGERPSGARAARWAEAIGQAGTRRLSLAELERLQRLVIGDARFVRLGLRDEGGFVGMHDRLTREPLPEHVSARPQDLPDLVGGIIDYAERAIDGGVDAVVAAAVIAFGFVYVHPFADGTAGSTGGSSTTSWRRPASTHPASSSRSAPRSSVGSTPTGACSSRTRHRCGRSSTGGQRTRAMSRC